MIASSRPRPAIATRPVYLAAMVRAILAALILAGCAAMPVAVDAGRLADANVHPDASHDAATTDIAVVVDAPDATSDAGPQRRALLLHDFIAGPTPTPTYVRDHLAEIEALPFDGIAIYGRSADLTTDISSSVMRAAPLDPAAVARVLAPVPEIVAGSLRESLMLVLNQRPGDLFDDAAWNVATSNFGVLATALRHVGARGIFFDNEEYGTRWGDYDVATATHTLPESIARARLRGHQAMQAMLDAYPDIVVLTLHGPYISEPRTPIPPFEGPFWMSNELLGAFFAGFVEAGGALATVVDGGEIYSLRVAVDFTATYEFRRRGIASDAIDSALVPPALRSLWPTRVSIAYGLYDRPFRGADMSPAILQATLVPALRTSDRYVWMYAEGITFLLAPGAGGADPAWLAAIETARATTGL